VFGGSLPLLQITPANIYPVTSDCNSFNFCPSLPTISTMWHDLSTLTVFTARSRVMLQNLSGPQLVKYFSIFYGTRRFIANFTKALHLSLCWTMVRDCRQKWVDFRSDNDEKQTWCYHSWYGITGGCKHFWVSCCCNVQWALSAGIPETIERNDKITLCQNTQAVILWTYPLRFYTYVI